MRVYTGTAWVAAYVPGDAVNISFTPYSTIAATNVQNAVQELTDEKLNLTGGTLTGALVNPLGSAAAPSLTFTGDTNTGIYSPGADQVAISTNGTPKILISDSTFACTIHGQSSAYPLTLDTTNVYGSSLTWQNSGNQYALAGAGATLVAGLNKDDLAINYNKTNASRNLIVASNGSERLRVTAGGLVGVGVSAPSRQLDVRSTALFDSNGDGTGTSPSIAIGSTSVGLSYVGGQQLSFTTGGAEKVRLDASGRLGIGTSSPQAILSITPSSSLSTTWDNWTGDAITFDAVNSTAGTGNYGPGISWKRNGSGATRAAAISSVQTDSDTDVLGLAFFTHGSGDNTQPIVERLRITGAGNVGIGTTSPGNLLHVSGTGTVCQLASSNNNNLINLKGNGATNGVWLGTTSSDDFLISSGASISERARIDSSGRLLVGTTTDTDSVHGTRIIPGVGGGIYVTNNTSDTSARVLMLNRQGGDGNLVDFRESNTLEGTISISGTTVSYNGAHLSRWSQLPTGAEREEILRGTVLSNIDEMCEWDEEDNEQLNRMKVSDVEGDKNVSGVFQAWDDDDDTYTDDFYCAMTGDFIIRIAAGTTVERGDLLMSAGDGTAKPQDDDIIRSKTIAKVTSTNVSCTHEDGSYCVPCVLMAC
jgi:hypothetical protein